MRYLLLALLLSWSVVSAKELTMAMPKNPYFTVTPGDDNWMMTGGDPRGGTSLNPLAPGTTFQSWAQQYFDPAFREQFYYSDEPGAVASRSALPGIVDLARAGFFNQFNLSPQESEWLGQAIAQEQAAGDTDVGGALKGLGDLGLSMDDLQLASVVAPAVGGAFASGATAGGASAPSIAESFQVAQAPGATMTDVTAGLGGGGGEAWRLAPEWGDPTWSLDPNTWAGAAPPPNMTLPSGEAAYGPAAPKTAPTGQEAPETPTSPDKGAAAGAGAAGGLAMRDVLQTAAAGAVLASALDGGGGEMDMGGELEESEEERQARIQASINAVNSAFSGFDAPYYTGIADAYRNYAMPQFSEQTKEARRRLPMTVPHTQSSAYNRKAAGLESDILREESNIGSESLNQANRRRGEVEMTKSELLNLASSSAPTETVAEQASTRAAQYAEPPQFSPIADLFEKYTADAANFAVLNRNKPNAQVVRPLTFSHSPSRSQRIIA